LTVSGAREPLHKCFSRGYKQLVGSAGVEERRWVISERSHRWLGMGRVK
jgi:hypothetical protein